MREGNLRKVDYYVGKQIQVQINGKVFYMSSIGELIEITVKQYDSSRQFWLKSDEKTCCIFEEDSVILVEDSDFAETPEEKARFRRLGVDAIFTLQS